MEGFYREQNILKNKLNGLAIQTIRTTEKCSLGDHMWRREKNAGVGTVKSRFTCRVLGIM